MQVDAWIAQLQQCKTLSEADIKRLCDKVRTTDPSPPSLTHTYTHTYLFTLVFSPIHEKRLLGPPWITSHPTGARPSALLPF